MEEKLKTFDDLQFENILDSYYAQNYDKQAVMHFANGYGVSVLLGSDFYSNGRDSYEVAILYGDEITYNTEIADDVLCWQTPEQVTAIMAKVQKLE